MQRSIYKWLSYILFTALSLFTLISYGEQSSLSPEEAKAFIKATFSNVIENANSDEEIYAQYFSKDYVQYVDGQKLNFNDFVAHMKAQKQAMRSMTVTFKYLIAEGNKIATVHFIDGIKKDGQHIKAQVNAVFEIKDRKIVLCDELTRLIEGKHSDKDLGSRH